MDDNPVWLRWATVLLLFVTVLTISLIMLGVFDPKPIGDEKWHQELTSQTIPPISRQVFWLEQPVPDESYSLRLTAAFESGELDASYGLIIGDDGHGLAVSVSPLGYVSIWQGSEFGSVGADKRSNFLMPWQTWPHVNNDSEANELWVDVIKSIESVDDRITIRVNREKLWEGAVPKIQGNLGFTGESFGEGTKVDYQTIQLFTE